MNRNYKNKILNERPLLAMDQKSYNVEKREKKQGGRLKMKSRGYPLP